MTTWPWPLREPASQRLRSCIHSRALCNLTCDTAPQITLWLLSHADRVRESFNPVAGLGFEHEPIIPRGFHALGGINSLNTSTTWWHSLESHQNPNPSDIQSEIVQHYAAGGDAQRLACVCESWRRLVQLYRNQWPDAPR